jgi:hypothetical protein
MSGLESVMRTKADVRRLLQVYAFAPWSGEQRKAIGRAADDQTAAFRVYSDSPVRAGTRVIRAPSALSRWSMRS